MYELRSSSHGYTIYLPRTSRGHWRTRAKSAGFAGGGIGGRGTPCGTSGAIALACTETLHAPPRGGHWKRWSPLAQPPHALATRTFAGSATEVEECTELVVQNALASTESQRALSRIGQGASCRKHAMSTCFAGSGIGGQGTPRVSMVQVAPA